MSQGTFSDALILWELFKEYFSGVQTFFQGVGPGFWVKMTKLLSGHFSLLYVPRDLGVS